MSQATKYAKDQPLLFTRGEDINIQCWYNKFDVKSGKHVIRFTFGDTDDNEKVTDTEICDINDKMTGYVPNTGVEYDDIIDVLDVYHIKAVWFDGAFYIPTDHITTELTDDLSDISRPK